MTKKNKNHNPKQPNLNKKKKKSSKKSWYMLLGILSLYGLLYLFNPEPIREAFTYTLQLILSILPVLFLVLIFMFLFNLINENKLRDLIMKSPNFLKYILMALLGTFSHGPIYAWYPLMATLHKKGLSYGTIASFLYARSIKLNFMPLAAVYFGLEYIVVLSILIFIFSYVQGILVDFFYKIEITGH